MAEEKDTAVAKTEEKAAVKAKDSKPAKPKKPKTPLKERITSFLREYKSELKKIVWYSKENTIKSSIFVIISLIICAAVLGLVDAGLSRAIMGIASLVG
jgi:preprotein translocase subunit SecE